MVSPGTGIRFALTCVRRRLAVMDGDPQRSRFEAPVMVRRKRASSAMAPLQTAVSASLAGFGRLAAACSLMMIAAGAAVAQAPFPSGSQRRPPSAAAAPPTGTVVDQLRGSWSGLGRAEFDGGTTENMRCTAYYRSPIATELMLAIRCARQDSRIELRGALKLDGERLTGTWQERVYNAEGTFDGSADQTEARLTFSGVATGTLSLRMDGSKQQVAVTSAGTGLKGFTITLDRN
jgi:hypothetical protein